MIYGLRLNENLEEDVEFLWVMQGGVRLDTSSHSFSIHTGEGAFINSNMLHYKEPLPGKPPLVLNQLFDVQLIAGGYKNIFEQKYIAPVISCKELEATVFKTETPPTPYC